MKNEMIWRIALIYILMLLVAGAILFQIIRLQFFESEKWINKSTPRKFTSFEVPSNRGNICAADGRILATTMSYYHIYFDAKVDSVQSETCFKNDIDSLSLCLSKFFKDASQAHYKQLLKDARNKGRRYFRINKRKVNFAEMEEIRKFPIFRYGPNLGGLIAEETSERNLPHGELAKSMLGSLKASQEDDKEGLRGIEAAFENELKGVSGKSVMRMMSGIQVPVPLTDPEDGYDVITTIDVDYQDIVHNALLKQLEKFEAESGTAILMDVKTGDVKAISNLSRTSSGSYTEQLNIAIRNSIVFGSVMKTATMIAVLEDGVYDLNDTVDLGGKGSYTFYEATMTESDNKKIGRESIRHIFEISSNGLTKLINDKYKDKPSRFVDRLYGMGLNKPTGIPFKGEGLPFIKRPGGKGWSGISLPWMSVGYEIELTPLQLLAFYNAIANDGQRMRPRIVKEIRQNGELIKSYPTEEVGGMICSRSTLRKVRELLVGVVENGTAKNIYTPNYALAGKTGTAITSSMKSAREYRASFVGYFPADRPLFSCLVVIDKPSRAIGYYASQVSSPVFREIADKVHAMSYLEIDEEEQEPQKTIPVSKNGYKQDFENIFNELNIDCEEEGVDQTDWVLTFSDETEDMLLKPRKLHNNLVPNVIGMGLRDALYILENAGLIVTFHGSGMVASQSLRAGTKIGEEGKRIEIELR
ncbi:MAG: transpeptidase family protein [Culturomica sp.]|nr:transpeptidase family protein [Culturomica sp.]